MERKQKKREPHLVSGMAPTPWFHLLRTGVPVRVDRWPDVAEISLRSLQHTALVRRETHFFGARIDAHGIAVAPVFIIGHYRSGTTYLHNLLTRDPGFAFPSTFDVTFPHAFLSAEEILKPILRRALPDKRCADNVPLGVDAPDEDEFALGKVSPLCFYNALYFPRQFRRHFERSVLLASPTDRETFKALYHRFLTKVSLKGEGRPIVTKNPAHSARIPLLLALFPEARFIHIHRNPFEVYLSTLHLYRSYISRYGFHRIDDETLATVVLYAYETLMGRMFADLSRIPKGRLAEVRYDTLLDAPLATLEGIYAHLGLDGFDDARPRFQAHIDAQATYRPNVHHLDDTARTSVGERWGFAFERLGYDRTGGIG